MAATYSYIIQNIETAEYKTTSGWDSNISIAETFTNPTSCKEVIDTLGTGYYIMLYVGRII